MQPVLMITFFFQSVQVQELYLLFLCFSNFFFISLVLSSCRSNLPKHLQIIFTSNAVYPQFWMCFFFLWVVLKRLLQLSYCLVSIDQNELQWNKCEECIASSWFQFVFLMLQNCPLILILGFKTITKQVR